MVPFPFHVNSGNKARKSMKKREKRYRIDVGRGFLLSLSSINEIANSHRYGYPLEEASTGRSALEAYLSISSLCDGSRHLSKVPNFGRILFCTHLWNHLGWLPRSTSYPRWFTSGNRLTRWRSYADRDKKGLENVLWLSFKESRRRKTGKKDSFFFFRFLVLFRREKE